MRRLPTGWTLLPTIENFDQISTTNKKIKTQDCLESGKYPVIDQGQALISGYINDFDKVIKVDNPVIIFGDHTRAVKWVEMDFVPGADGTKVLKPKPYLNGRFSYYQLKSLEIPEKGYSRHFKFLKEILFAIPPLNEQMRIADKLDSVLAKVDAAQTRLEKIPTLLKRFRKSVLAAATSGELTREWRANNKIEAAYTTLGEAGIEVKTGPFGSALHKEEYVSGGIPVINPMHIRDGNLYPSPEMTITKDKFNDLKAWKLEVGDVVIGRRGEMGRAAEITNDKRDLLCGTGSMIIKPTTGLVSPAYLCLVLRSPNSVAYFEANSVGSTMVNLNQKIIKSLSFHYPSSEEQKEIVRRVESLFALADAVEKQYLSAKQRLDRLTQSLLAKAFRGELVPQDPNDDPAAELLKRIQAERHAQPPTKHKRKQQA